MLKLLFTAVPLAAGFLVRLFMIQHDCRHGSFFSWRKANNRLGRLIGVFTPAPYDYWRRAHAAHHATTGDLDRRGTGDVPLLLVAEYRARSRGRRIAYRLARNPLALLGLGPFYLFVLKYRLPVGMMRDSKGVWISVMSTNLSIAGVVVILCALIGIENFLLLQLPITLLAGSIGIWLFYMQHQFEDTYWATHGGWDFHESALQGAAHYDLPAVLRWFTANIGIHHVHHLACRIPSYRLREALANHPQLHDVGRLTLRQSLECFRLALWDDECADSSRFASSGGRFARDPRIAPKEAKSPKDPLSSTWIARGLCRRSNASGRERRRRFEIIAKWTTGGEH